MMDITNVFYRSFALGIGVDAAPYGISSIILIISKLTATQKNSVFIMILSITENRNKNYFINKYNIQ